MEPRFKLRILGFDTILNYQLSKKLKVIEKDKFNYLIITLTLSSSAHVKESVEVIIK